LATGFVTGLLIEHAFEQNLVEKQPESNLAAMLVAKLLPFTENLSTRKWSDNDIVEDIEYLKAELEENFHSLR
jgi:V-type H+-transporting ATPase subunit H